MQVKVIEVLDGHRAVVSTRGLRRVVEDCTGKIVDELVPIVEANAMADGYAGCFEPPGERLRVEPYRSAC